MIIKNNFNKKNASPLTDYEKIGKGSKNIEKDFNKTKDGYITDNINNDIIKEIIDKDHEYLDDDSDNDSSKWDFFR